MFKKIICLFLSVIMVFALSACTQTAWTATEFDTEIPSALLSDGKVLAENDNYRLEWISYSASVALVDKTTGDRWCTTPTKEGEPTVDDLGMPIKKNPQLSSPILIEYMDNNSNSEEKLIGYTAAVTGGRIRASLIKNGVRVEYYFDDASIMVPVEYVLRDNSVAVTVDPNEIQESTNTLNAISILPFWCSAENDAEDAYLFVPSGSGALISNQTISQQGTTYSASVYGDDAVMRVDDLVTIKKSARLPVFGSKQGNKGAVAIIESAAESVDIDANIGSGVIGYSGIYATYQVRGYSYTVFSPLGEQQVIRNIFAKDMNQTPMTVAYYPLKDDNASYSGMAEVYKNYLKETKAVTEKTDDSSLNVTFVGGAMVNKSFLGVPYQDLVAATTLKDAQDILTELSEKTGVKISAKLLGFGSTGIETGNYAGDFQIHGNLGSQKDLTNLSEFCGKNNIDLYMDFDLVKLKNGSQGFSTFFDTAYNSLYKVGYGYDYDLAIRSYIADTQYAFLTRGLLSKGLDKLLKKTAKWDLPGISLETLTSIAYSDYSDRKSTLYYSKGNMAEDVTEMMKKVSETHKVAAYDANAYAALAADIVFETPMRSSQESIFKADVPFYQMVFKGFVPMSGETVNIASNEQEVLLKSVETGCGLNYVLTANYYNEFIDSQNNYFFGSKYSDINDKLIKNYTDLKDYYAAINGAEIVSHKMLDGGLRETVFDNGVKVYVNYSEASAVSPIGEVAAESFVWEK